MNIPYTLINLEQGTAEWIAWRSEGIGASDAPSIMGENPWKRPARLLAEKLGTSNSFRGNAATARGTTLEPHARMRYEEISNIPVSPACLQSNRHTWQRASVDGLAMNKETVIEIKCGESVYKKTANSGKVPVYYIGQLQHILAVTGLPVIDFFCWLPDRPEIHLCINRDDEYIARLLVAEQAFWERLMEQKQQRRQRLADVDPWHRNGNG